VLPSESMSRALLMAGFGVTLYGRIWVIPEVSSCAIFNTSRSMGPGSCWFISSNVTASGQRSSSSSSVCEGIHLTVLRLVGGLDMQ
jgi:hypothetical protein